MPIFAAPSLLSAVDDGSSSIQQVSVLSSTTQEQIKTCPHTGINFPIPHPAADATGSPPNIGSTIQETEQVFYGHMSTHPPVIADWVHPFNEWLPTRRHQMMAFQGLGDPLACRPVWARVFGQWFQLHQLLSSHGFDDLAVLPHSRGWNEVFEFWLQQLLMPDIQGLDAPHTSAHPTFSAGSPATSNILDAGSPCSTPPPRKARKRIPNAVSKLAVPEIQESCRRNKAEESVIARIAVVFPGVVAREQLKLAGQPGDQRDHQGYMEFAERHMVSSKNVKKRKNRSGYTGAGQVQRWGCKLCGLSGHPRWKNSKDLLDHVWDTHCDPQGDGKPFLSFRTRVKLMILMQSNDSFSSFSGSDGRHGVIDFRTNHVPGFLRGISSGFLLDLYVTSLY